MVEPASQAARRFHAHDRATGRGSGHLVPGAEDFHDAALLFAERWAAAEPSEVAVVVKDCDSGEEQCFVVHLDDGDVEPC